MTQWKDMPIWQRVIIGLGLGVVSGLALRFALGAETASQIVDIWLKPFGDAFVRLIRMLVAPLIFTTLVTGVTSMGDPARMGGIGGRTIGLYLLTTWVAVSFGLLMASLLQPGNGVDVSLAGGEALADISSRLDRAGAASASVSDRFLAIIPTNPVAAIAELDVLAVIFFAILFGAGCLFAGDKAKPVVATIESAAEVMLKLTSMIMQLAPYGVFFLMSWVMGKHGLSVLDNLALLALALYAACFLQIFFVYALGLVRGVLGLPMGRFFRGIADAQAVAFSVSSSSATLPVTIANVSENLGVKRSVASSVLPVGATINMDGTAAYLGIIALFAAQAAGFSPGLTDYALIALTATLASIGSAGIPSASLFLATGVITVFQGPDGLPLISEAQAALVIAFIFPFDRLLDMMRTVTNVTGDAAVACAVAKWEGELDEDVFRAS